MDIGTGRRNILDKKYPVSMLTGHVTLQLTGVPPIIHISFYNKLTVVFDVEDGPRTRWTRCVLVVESPRFCLGQPSDRNGDSAVSEWGKTYGAACVEPLPTGWNAPFRVAQGLAHARTGAWPPGRRHRRA